MTDLLNSEEIVAYEQGYLLKSDFDLLHTQEFEQKKTIFVLHRNDFLVKSNEHWLKIKYKHPEYDILQ